MHLLFHEQDKNPPRILPAEPSFSVSNFYRNAATPLWFNIDYLCFFISHHNGIERLHIGEKLKNNFFFIKSFVNPWEMFAWGFYSPTKKPHPYGQRKEINGFNEQTVKWEFPTLIQHWPSHAYDKVPICLDFFFCWHSRKARLDEFQATEVQLAHSSGS